MILFRLNAGKHSGLGHLSRNLTLAKSLKKFGILSTFIIKSDNYKFVSTFIKDNFINFEFNFIGVSLDYEYELNYIIELYKSSHSKLLILDHYDHDYEYCRSLKNQGINLCQYDFNAKNKILADIIINPNIGFSKKNYLNISKSNAIICAGHKYILIKDSLKNIQLKSSSLNCSSKKNILIAMGGGEYPIEIINLILEITKKKEYNFTVISSDSIIKKLNQNNLKVLFGNIDFDLIYSKTNISLVSGGVTTQELAFLKIPMLVYPFRSNQIINASNLIANGLAKELNINKFDELLNFQVSQTSKLKIDGLGAERISKVIYNYINKL